MSEYRVRASGELKSETDLRLENRNVSFPKVWNTNVFEALGIDPVLATPAPTPSGEFKIVARNGAVQDSNGNWVQAWVEREMFTEYTDEEGNVQTVSAQQTAYTTRRNNEKAVVERATRDNLLKETDHFALSDVTMTDAMRTYRQALRDVPQQSEFPNTITWPTKPE
jgi:hypothetical protein|tara:strand:- start:236 stop:736 length:501 start_codon:yes stop_codon:yes gene_type:complete